MAIFFVAHAMYIMILSMHTTKVYDRLHCHSVADLMTDYTKEMENKINAFLFTVPYLPVSSLRQAVEFKIIYALFRDTFWLPSDFDYGSYLGRSFEKYSLRMINIGLSSWVIMIFLSGVNYVRILLGPSLDFLSCDSGADIINNQTIEISGTQEWNPFVDPFYEQRLLKSKLSHDCSFMHLKIFVICGTMIAFYALTLFLIGRFYLKRLIGRAGATTTSDYYKFLMLEESITLKQTATRNIEIKIRNNDGNKKKNGRRMSINTFRHNVNTLLKDKPKSDKDEHMYENLASRSRSSVMGKAVASLRKTFISKSASQGAVMPDRSPIGSNSKKSLLHIGESPPGSRKKKYDDTMAPPSGPPVIPGRRKNMVIKLSKGNSKKNLKDVDELESLTSIEQFKLLKIKEMREQKIERAQSNRRMMISYLRDKSSSESTDNLQNMKLSEDFSEIYFFRSPQLYFKMVEIAIMLNSLYLSLWACNFITLVNDHFDSSPFFHIVMLIPLLVVLPSLGEIVKVSSLLAAVADLDLDVIGSVLEVTEEKTKLVAEVREKILTRIHGKHRDKLKILQELFEEIDINSNGQVNKHELREMLRALSLHYSDYKFRRLYEAIDHDGSGAMDMDEFIDLVFPDMARKREVRRRAELLKQHSDAYNEENSGEIDLGPHQSGFKSTIARFQTEASPEVSERCRGRSWSGESYRSLGEVGPAISGANEGREELKISNDIPVSNMRISQIMRHHNLGRDCSDHDRIEEEESVLSYDQSVELCRTPPSNTCGVNSKSPRHLDVQELQSSHKKELYGDKECLTPTSFEGPVECTSRAHISAVQHLDHLRSNEGSERGSDVSDLDDSVCKLNANKSDLSDDDANINEHSESVHLFEVIGENGNVINYDDDVHNIDNNDSPFADNAHHDYQSVTGSYYSVYDSDDNSLMTSTLRGNKELDLEESPPISPRRKPPKRTQSVELTTLLSNSASTSNKTTHHTPSFKLNNRAANALYHITASSSTEA